MEILVVGIARSGIASANYLAGKGHNVTITDAKTVVQLGKELEALDKKVNVKAGGHSGLAERFDLLVTSPGVPWESAILSGYRDKGIPVISEIELAFNEFKRDWVAITGTNGKSTTTSLVGKMLKEAGITAVVCGNIGNPVIGEKEIEKEGTCIVAEISSFQLEGVEKFAPTVAAILNVTPDHLDRHGAIENYIEIKSRIFRKQDSESYCVLNMDDPVTARLAGNIPSRLFGFSTSKKLVNGAFVEDGRIVLAVNGNDEVIGSVTDLLLIGTTGVENGIAATAIASCAGADAMSIRKALFAFTGLSHRMELVAEHEGVRYINDSKATNVHSAIKGLEGIEGALCVILGGRDKDMDFMPLADLIRSKESHAVLIGEAASKIARSFGDYGKIEFASSMREAVEIGSRKVSTGGSLVLSPACASFDMFKDYEERGAVFSDMVRERIKRRSIANAEKT